MFFLLCLCSVNNLKININEKNGVRVGSAVVFANNTTGVQNTKNETPKKEVIAQKEAEKQKEQKAEDDALYCVVYEDGKVVARCVLCDCAALAESLK